jgi:hypothetical protein
MEARQQRLISRQRRGAPSITGGRKQREKQAREGAEARGEGQVGFSTPRMRGKTSSMPVKSLHASWQRCTVAWTPRPELDVSRMREPTETLPFLGLYLSNRKAKQQNNCTTIQCYKSTKELLKRSQAKTDWFAK